MILILCEYWLILWIKVQVLGSWVFPCYTCWTGRTRVVFFWDVRKRRWSGCMFWRTAWFHCTLGFWRRRLVHNYWHIERSFFHRGDRRIASRPGLERGYFVVHEFEFDLLDFEEVVFGEVSQVEVTFGYVVFCYGMGYLLLASIIRRLAWVDLVNNLKNYQYLIQTKERKDFQYQEIFKTVQYHSFITMIHIHRYSIFQQLLNIQRATFQGLCLPYCAACT